MMLSLGKSIVVAAGTAPVVGFEVVETFGDAGSVGTDFSSGSSGTDCGEEFCEPEGMGMLSVGETSGTAVGAIGVEGIASGDAAGVIGVVGIASGDAVGVIGSVGILEGIASGVAGTAVGVIGSVGILLGIASGMTGASAADPAGADPAGLVVSGRLWAAIGPQTLVIKATVLAAIAH